MDRLCRKHAIKRVFVVSSQTAGMKSMFQGDLQCDEPR